ncbi:lymphotoxin-beta isoform X3 [Ranitomeya variabilis]|uniref:lymphotoxin-beta isoform X3 n=1 Tax=Ranitomeya variabilis TaxID=490064 RepID=UPI004056B95D
MAETRMQGRCVHARLQKSLECWSGKCARFKTAHSQRLKDNQKTNCQKKTFTKPAAHLIGQSPSQEKILNWKEAFIQSIKPPMNTTLEAPKKGLYYVYCQVGFEGMDANLTLFSQVITWNNSSDENDILIFGKESVTGRPLRQRTWHASLTLGRLANLVKGQKLYVYVSHPNLVDYTEGKTFFGIVMVS